jgi:hypothetical protein
MQYSKSCGSGTGSEIFAKKSANNSVNLPDTQELPRYTFKKSTFIFKETFA